ncbi:MAG: glycosyltransferase family 39 protein [Bacteroidales bacterium]
MRITFKPYIFFILAILYGLVFLLPFSGAVHLFDWDEIIYAESAREMIVNNDYMTVTINYEPFWEKPPMFIWLQVISMKIFGINEFAARFPNAICGVIVLISLFLTGKRIHGDKFGMLWAAAFGTAILPFFYFRTGIIDPWFNLFIFYGFIFFIFYLVPERFPRRHINVALSALFLGLAVLTKGPVAVLIFALSFSIYLVYKKAKLPVKFSHVVLFIFVLAVVGGSWFLVAVLKGNMQVIKDFIAYQSGLLTNDFAGHSGFPGFHFVILLVGVFPASILMLGGFTKKKEEGDLAQTFRTWMFILIALVLVLFSFVETKLVHYSSLAYFPMTFIAAWFVYHWSERKIEIKKIQLVLLGVIAFILVSLTALVPTLLMRPEILTERFSSLMTPYVEGVLLSGTGWSILDYLPAVILLAGIAYSINRINRRDRTGMIVLHTTALLFTFSAMLLFVPKIERMIQKPAIDFMKQHSGEHENVITLGFKSFAPYFYGAGMPEEQQAEMTEAWLEGEEGTKPLYVVMKADNSRKILDKYPHLIRLGEQGGYVFAVFGEKMENANSAISEDGILMY